MITIRKNIKNLKSWLLSNSDDPDYKRLLKEYRKKLLGLNLKLLQKQGK